MQKQELTVFSLNLSPKFISENDKRSRDFGGKGSPYINSYEICMPSIVADSSESN